MPGPSLDLVARGWIELDHKQISPPFHGEIVDCVAVPPIQSISKTQYTPELQDHLAIVGVEGCKPLVLELGAGTAMVAGHIGD